MSRIMQLKSITKSFVQGGVNLQVLRSVNLQIEQGEAVALVGASGSGKTTLLQIAGLLANADSGSLTFKGSEVRYMKERLRTKLRGESLGFVYQFHHLLPEFTAIENVVLPQLVVGKKQSLAIKYAEQLLEEFGLADRMAHRPSQLSGGEMQRVAIARALANDPALLLADEPTGNLDNKSAENVFTLLMNAIEKRNMAALIATHNTELASRMSRIVTLEKGELS